MRPIALNRKNALFAGDDLGAENWAVLASLIETCKLHDVNPEAWLADVLTRLANGWPNRRLAELTPGRPPNTPSTAPPLDRGKGKAGASRAPLTLQRFSSAAHIPPRTRASSGR
jgi:IS66 C-terminal element